MAPVVSALGDTRYKLVSAPHFLLSKNEIE